MKRFVEGEDRLQGILLPEFLDDYVAEDNLVRVIDVSSSTSWICGRWGLRASFRKRQVAQHDELRTGRADCRPAVAAEVGDRLEVRRAIAT